MTADRELPSLKYQEEIRLLRRVYEEARAVLRYSGVDEKRFMTAWDNLDAAIEKVKLLDSGLDECG